MTYKPQILDNSRFFVNMCRFLLNCRCTDHSLACLLHYVDDVATCLGSPICGRGVLLACERAAANYVVSFIHAVIRRSVAPPY